MKLLNWNFQSCWGGGGGGQNKNVCSGDMGIFWNNTINEAEIKLEFPKLLGGGGGGH